MTVDHEIRAGHDEVDFQFVATNPTAVASQAHWAQPCIRVDKYAGVQAAGCFGSLSAAVLRVCGWQASTTANDPLGQGRPVHSRPGLVPGRRQPG